jgi:hypothetical protein
MAALQPKLLSILTTPRRPKDERPKNQLRLIAASKSAAGQGTPRASAPVIIAMVIFALLRAVLSPGCQSSPSTRYPDPVRTNQTRSLKEDFNRLGDPRGSKGSQTSPKVSGEEINESLKRFLEQQQQNDNSPGSASQELP